MEDARGDGVKCLNGEREIAFDEIEGKKSLEGRTVVRGPRRRWNPSLRRPSRYLNIPEIESQENERADRH